MSNPRSEQFLQSVLDLPSFSWKREVKELHDRLGNAPELVQAIVDSRYVGKDDACKLWADSMEVAYVDPFASVITDEAISLLPVEIAKKARVIGLYVVNDVLPVAAATPNDSELMRRLVQLLADRAPAPDDLLPATGIALERERALSSSFIAGELYGTRASTVVLVREDGEALFLERTFGSGGVLAGETVQRFRVDAANQSRSDSAGSIRNSMAR